MHLPGPLRAAVGLVATAAAEAKHLPDRAIELPMLVVSSALQASLRAQQRYARYAARGDEVLNRRVPSEQPPPWATFDDPLPVGDLRVSADGSVPGRSSLEHLFAVQDPTMPLDGREPVGEVLPPDEPPPSTPAAIAAPARKPVAKKAATRKVAPRKAAAKKPAVKKAATKKTSTGAGAAKKTSDEAATPSAGVEPAADGVADTQAKTVSKPRHTEPSAFDNVVDD